MVVFGGDLGRRGTFAGSTARNPQGAPRTLVLLDTLVVRQAISCYLLELASKPGGRNSVVEGLFPSTTL